MLTGDRKGKRNHLLGKDGCTSVPFHFCERGRKCHELSRFRQVLKCGGWKDIYQDHITARDENARKGRQARCKGRERRFQLLLVTGNCHSYGSCGGT